jgi:hypothetical protein
MENLANHVIICQSYIFVASRPVAEVAALKEIVPMRPKASRKDEETIRSTLL